MKLTPDLIESALSYLNPLKERELDLRGQHIDSIENLGVAGPHDAIDFTDNDVSVLGNFPLSPRITTLLLARNRVSSIQPALGKAIPNLQNLVLASNDLAELADLDVLGLFARLTHLVLTDNPVTKLQHYRYWVLWRCPSVRFLDYQKVKDVEREKSRELFGSAEEPTALATKILSKKSSFFERSAANGSAQSKLSRIKLTPAERKRIQERIQNATNLQEIMALEKELNEGRLPSGIHDDDVMQE
ncbi:hypothetical protein CDD81_4225 [Ophiocordyceps australis]|uniref:U2 small nuclear ribonucleoprotein A' n=1 Tax=Ophiocordyceps australis TaxID=1399860 RepID=A0A2C5YCC9_9HYPO|nr:hypothetical protein CDD81_4225 [Ophiocordyceps australis]